MTNRPRRTGRGPSRDRTIDLPAEKIAPVTDAKKDPGQTWPGDETSDAARAPEAGPTMPMPQDQPPAGLAATGHAPAPELPGEAPTATGTSASATLKDFAAQEGLDPNAPHPPKDAPKDAATGPAGAAAIGIVGPAPAKAGAKAAGTAGGTVGAKAAGTGPSTGASAGASALPSSGASAPSASAEREPSRNPVPAPATIVERRGGGLGTALAAGVVGALIAVGGAAALQSQGLLPTLGLTRANENIAVLSGSVETLRGQVEALSQRPVATPESVSALETRLGETATAATSAGESAASAQRAAEAASGEAKAAADALQPVKSTAEGAAQGAQAAATAAAAAQQSANGAQETANTAADTANRAAETAGAAQEAAAKAAADSTAALKGFEDRIGAIEEASRKASAALAAANLKSAIDRGGPFMGELETYASVAEGAPSVASLRQYAPDGVPTLGALQADWPQAQDAISAALRPEASQAPIQDQVLSGLRSLVQVRPAGQAAVAAAPGDAGTLARLDAAIEGGDLSAWKGAWETLPEAARSASADFAKRVDARLAGQKAVEDALSSAITAPAAGTPAGSGNQG